MPDDVSPDPYPELPVERGPHGRGVGRWVVDEKHRYLARYLDATREAQKKFKQRVLIDPFCGPGRIQVEGEDFTRDGGSIAAYRQSVRSGAPFTKLLVGDIDANVSKLNQGERRIPIRVRLAEGARSDLAAIRNLRLPTATGGFTTLETVADVTFEAGPAQIDRFDRKRILALAWSVGGVCSALL